MQRTYKRRFCCTSKPLWRRHSLLDTFEVTRDHLLQKRLKDLVRRRGLEVQQNLRYERRTLIAGFGGWRIYCFRILSFEALYICFSRSSRMLASATYVPRYHILEWVFYYYHWASLTSYAVVSSHLIPFIPNMHCSRLNAIWRRRANNNSIFVIYGSRLAFSLDPLLPRAKYNIKKSLPVALGPVRTSVDLQGQARYQVN